MSGRRIFLSAALMLGLGYLSAPYVTMWWLYSALCAEDAVTLQAMIDWDRVRSGIKQDVMEGLIGVAEPQMVIMNRLPPFGTGFAGGIASTFVDRTITPQSVAVMLRAMGEQTTGEAPYGSGALGAAFFSSPMVFTLSVRAPGQDPEDPPLRVQMELRGMRWIVTRAWVPQDLIDRVHIRT